MSNRSFHSRLFHLAATLAIVVAVGSAGLAQTKIGVAYFGWNGSLVPSFGSGGLVTTDFPPATDAWARALVVDSLGRLLVVGADADGQIALACYNRSSGALEPSFGVGGRVVTNFGAHTTAQANSAAIASNGDIIVAGSVYYLGAEGANFAILRYTAQGALLQSEETSFPGPSSDVAHALAIDASGRVVVVGRSILSSGLGGGDGRIALARYDSQLKLDPTFDGDGDTDGLILTNLRPNSDAGTLDREQANGIALIGSRIVIAGHTVFGVPVQDWYGGEFLVVRYLSNGALDIGFDGDGIAMPFVSLGGPFDKTVRANAVAVDTAGRILAAGRASMNSGGPHVALVRFNANGSLDTTFSGDGKVLTGFGWSAPSEATAIAVRGTSSILLAGWAGTGPSVSAVVTRYASNGSLDTTFDGDGRAVANFNCHGQEKATAIALLMGTGPWQTLPRIFIAGNALGDPCP